MFFLFNKKTYSKIRVVLYILIIITFLVNCSKMFLIDYYCFFLYTTGDSSIYCFAPLCFLRGKSSYVFFKKFFNYMPGLLYE